MPNTNTSDPDPAGDNQERTSVIQLLLRDQDSLVRRLTDSGAKSKLPMQLAFLAIICFLVFGLVMGTLSGGTQLYLAPLKVGAGIVAASLICFPSFYIFLCLSGAPLSLKSAMSLLIAMMAIAGLLLVGLAPVVWIFTQSTNSIVFIATLCLICWTIALYFGTQLFGIITKALPGKQGKHLNAWVLIFTLVTLQMTTSLRPLLGTSPEILPTEKKFFLHHWIESMGR